MLLIVFSFVTIDNGNSGHTELSFTKDAYLPTSQDISISIFVTKTTQYLLIEYHIHIFNLLETNLKPEKNILLNSYLDSTNLCCDILELFRPCPAWTLVKSVHCSLFCFNKWSKMAARQPLQTHTYAGHTHTHTSAYSTLTYVCVCTL